MNHVYTARRSYLAVVSIEKALGAGDFHSLMEITKVHDFADLLTADMDSSYQKSAGDAGTMSVPQSLEAQLLIKHAQTIIVTWKRKLIMIQCTHVAVVIACTRGSL